MKQIKNFISNGSLSIMVALILLLLFSYTSYKNYHNFVEVANATKKHGLILNEVYLLGAQWILFSQALLAFIIALHHDYYVNSHFKIFSKAFLIIFCNIFIGIKLIIFFLVFLNMHILL